jgi:glucokinase
MIDKEVYLVVDVGGTFLKSAVMNINGSVLDGSDYTIPSYSNASESEVLASLKTCINEGLSFAVESGCRMKGIGFSIPGPFDYRNGISLMKHKFHGLYQLNLKELIRSMPGVGIDMLVCFIHDANAVLIGEQWFGNAQNYNNSAVVTLGTGIGFAHSQNKIIQCNSLGSPSVSIYSTPCRNGILEDYVSQRGILKIYNDLNPENVCNDLTVQEIGKYADEGDTTSLRTFLIMGEILARSLSHILQERMIECLLLGGQISKSYHLFEQSLKEGLNDVESLQQISPVKNIEHAAFYGILASINLCKDI